MKPVTIELTDVKTKEKIESLEVDACLVATGRAPYTHVSPFGFCCFAQLRRMLTPISAVGVSACVVTGNTTCHLESWPAMHIVIS